MGQRSWLTRTGEDDSDAYAAAAQVAIDEAKKTQIGSKVANVAADATKGAAMGAVAGPYGAAIGAAAGAVYGAVDQFGGYFNPPDFSEDDYTRIKNKCVNGYNGGPRGEIVGGIAPDQYGACRYRDPQDPTGYVYSGGDAPFPGSWNMGWDGDGKILDQAAWDRWHGQLCGGVPLVPGMNCVNNQQVPPKPFMPAAISGNRLLSLIDQEQARRSSIVNTSKLSSSTVARVIAATPPPAPAAKPTFALASALNPAAAARAAQNAHVLVADASAGVPAAKATIGAITEAAKAGHPVAQLQANLLTAAAKLQIRAKYIRKYLGIVTTGAAPMVTSCGCRPH